MPTEHLFTATIEEMRNLYFQNEIPWIVGFSGGKDSSTVVQLVYRMLLDLPAEKRHKKVHIIASDTLVESPVVEEYLEEVMESLRGGIVRDRLPIEAHKVVPDISESFWVLLLGKGYPSPNRFFRWCTERLKIKPTARYIQRQVDEWGSVIILLGARKAESASRAQVIENHKIAGSVLRRHATMPQAYVYTPICDWQTEDVWSYLMINEAPWAPHLKLNSKLRELYRDAAGGECPLVLDKSTPSCGQSRFGCWTCTVIDTDSSMEGFLEVGKQYQWMQPLLDFRNKLKAYRDDPSKRERWRRNDPNRHTGGAAAGVPDQLSFGNASPLDEQVLGPFTLEIRKDLLRELLEIQKKVGRVLIQEEELELIRQHWTEDYRVDEFFLLEILEDVFGPTRRRQQKEIMRGLLRQTCQDHGVDLHLVDRLIDLERGYVTKLRKRGLYGSLDRIIDEWLHTSGGNV